MDTPKISTLMDLLSAEKHGISVRYDINPITGSVIIGLTQVLRNDSTRLAWTLVNLGAADIYVGFDPQVAATRGIYVGASGGSLTINYNDDLILPIQEVFVRSTAAQSIYVVTANIGR